MFTFQFNGTAIANTLKDMFDLPGGYPVLLYMPVVEPDFGQERFLTDDPNILYRDGHFARVPVMAGVTKYEFLYPAIGNENALSFKFSFINS